MPEQLLPLLTQQQLAQREETVSQDRKTTIMRLTLTGDFDQALKNVEPVLDVVHEADSEDGFSVLIVGDASISHEQNELAESDLRQGERIGLPVALIILVVLFGTIVAALMPVGLSIVCIVVAFGITALIGQAFDLIFNLNRFTGLFETSVFDEAGISYSCPTMCTPKSQASGDAGASRLGALKGSGSSPALIPIDLLHVPSPHNDSLPYEFRSGCTA